ncbi:alpha/beta fold hydrolase [Microbacterium rhizomatis]|uniref:Alpha/beta hydrolase n=1 Tax=Microbacterium rhizomatis TaxID=1631477 RepID=A0A5J5J4A3_9MICO|nr:alpha/beta hydrolase [Microbacterium rhizomatis]KAA9108078.1 alpha/beta hydrolase [Microbacterium rhizomatis]
MTSRPAVVLVHGAFTDASSWWPITLRLLGSGRTVFAPPVDGHSFVDDCDHVRRFVERIDGPVLLVGHAYGGAVITVAGAAHNVVGLVYVAGYALDGGESIGALRDRFPDSDLARHLVSAFGRRDGDSGTEITVEVAEFPQLLGEGAPSDELEVMAVSQRPLSVSILTESVVEPAWRSRPSWGVVASADRSLSPELQRFAYQRAGARRIVELDAPHLVMQTHPIEVVALIDTALNELVG